MPSESDPLGLYDKPRADPLKGLDKLADEIKPPEMQKKHCMDCGEDKFKDQFAPNTKSADGLANRCRLCIEKRRVEERAKRANVRLKRVGGDVDALVEEFETHVMPKDFLAGQWLDIVANTDNDQTRATALKALGELYGFKGGDKDAKDERALIQAVLKAKREAEMEEEAK